MANSYLDTQEADSLADKIFSAGFIHKDDVEVSEDRLWEIFAESKGCKKHKEDCSFKRCHSWAECYLLADALAQDKSWIK